MCNDLLPHSRWGDAAPTFRPHAEITVDVISGRSKVVQHFSLDLLRFIQGAYVAGLCISKHTHGRRARRSKAHCTGGVVVLEPWQPLPDSQWPSPDGDVKRFKCYRAIRALWRFAMAHKDVETEQTGSAKKCQSHQSTIKLDAGTHGISKDVATGRLVMLSMLSAASQTVPCGSCGGGWHAFSNVLSDSGSWFTILRDP
eukprot:Skav212154  [mRNA]  locus=scaffold754:79347:80247:+ [translate_table: standard]